LYSPEADEILDRLEADDARRTLLARINQALDRLEENPGDAWCRRRRFQNIGVRGIAVVSDGTEWLILWSPGTGGTTGDDAVIVEAIVPAP
jgi:hypothetical protein